MKSTVNQCLGRSQIVHIKKHIPMNSIMELNIIIEYLDLPES